MLDKNLVSAMMTNCVTLSRTANENEKERLREIWKSLNEMKGGKKFVKHVCQVPEFIQEALNSGDGIYRP